MGENDAKKPWFPCVILNYDPKGFKPRKHLCIRCLTYENNSKYFSDTPGKYYDTPR